MLRQAWLCQNVKRVIAMSDELEERDITALEWAYDALQSRMKGADPRDMFIDGDYVRVSMEMPGVSKGRMDAVSYLHRFNVDYKSGQVRDYKPQHACYARGCILKLQQPDVEWTSVSLFMDQQIEREYTFTLKSATDYIQSILDKPLVPTACEQCAWCVKKMTCPEGRKLMLDSAAESPAQNQTDLYGRGAQKNL